MKWCSLPYEDSTWELKQDIDQAKIEEFEKLMSREPEMERVVRIGSVQRILVENKSSTVAFQEPLMGFAVFETGATSCR